MSENQILFLRKDKSNKSDEEGDSTTAEDDMWDDTELVLAFDRAVTSAKGEVVRRIRHKNGNGSGNESSMSNKTKSKKKRKRKNKKEWQVGDACRSVYTEDGVTYEATITSVFPDKGTCIVAYVGYDNAEEVPLKLLEPSFGPVVRNKQQMMALQEEEMVDMDLNDVEGASVHPRPGSGQANKMEWEPRTARPPEPHFMTHQYRPFRMPTTGMPSMMIPPPPPPHLMNSFPEEDSEALSAMLMSWYMSGFHTGYYQGLKQAKNCFPNGGDCSRTSSRKK